MNSTRRARPATFDPGARRRRTLLATAAASTWLAAALAIPAPAGAAGGSGSAALLGPSPVAAGSRGTWTVRYLAGEDFDHPVGGRVEITVPSGWTPPQTTNPTLPGYVEPASYEFVTSLTTQGATIRLVLGQSKKLLAGQVVDVLYGKGGGSARPFAQTAAPDTAMFLVASQPGAADTLAALSLGSPSIPVAPDTVTYVRIVDDDLAPVGARSLTTDDDGVQFHLQGYDTWGNPSRLVEGTWTLPGGVGSVSPTTGTTVALTLTSPGTGFVAADSGSWSDFQGPLTVTHGAYASLEPAAAGSAAAGSPFAASIAAVDGDGNTIDAGPGAGASVRFIAYADSITALPADPDLVSADATLAAGTWTGTLTARRAGTYFLAARDSAAGIESPARVRVVIVPGPADHVALEPDTLSLVAGAADTLRARALDPFGNAAPLQASQRLTLWSDRPAGSFRSLGGAPIFEIFIPVGSSSSAFLFTDTGSTSSPGRVRVIDADATPPDLGTATSYVLTAPGAPVGPVALSARPDTLTADGIDSTEVVSSAVRDAYGNAVSSGERFTLAGTLLTAITDIDPSTPGAQIAADGGGIVRGWLRSGTLKGGGSIQVASERGGAAGSVTVPLLAGPPEGALALSADPDSLPADSVSAVRITASDLVDAYGNAVEEGEAFTVATTLGSITTSDADSGTPGIQVGAQGGVIAIDLMSSDQLGTALVTAASVRGGAFGSIPIRLVPGPVSPVRSAVIAPAAIVVGPAGDTLRVILRDANDHALPAVPADSVGVVSIGAVASAVPLAPATDQSGVLEYRLSATVADTATVRVTARGVALDAGPSVAFVPAALDHYVLSGPAGPLTAGTPESIAVGARDAFGNPLPARSGDVVRLTVPLGAGAVPDSIVLASGAGSFALLPTLAAALAVEARDDSARTGLFGPVDVAPGPGHRLIAPAPAAGSVPVGDSLLVSARVFDVNGNPVPGASVEATIVLGDGSILPGTRATDATGAAAFSLRAGSSPGPLEARLVIPSSPAPDSVRADTVRVGATPGPGRVLTITESAQAMEAGGLLDLTLAVRDSFGNVVPGATPSVLLRTTSTLPDSVGWFLAGGAQGTLDPGAGGDSATYSFAASDGGTATLSLRSVRAETIQVLASGSGFLGGASGAITVTAAGAAALEILDGDGQAATVDRALASPLRVRVRDAFANTVAGASVLFGVAGGSGGVDVIAGAPVDSVAVSAADGVATCAVARVGTLAGADTDSFFARLLAMPSIEARFTASARPDSASTLLIAPAVATVPAGGAADVTATARDRFGNAVPGVALTLYLGAPLAGSLESLGATAGGPGSQSGSTNAAGSVAVRYRAPTVAPSSDSLFAASSPLAAAVAILAVAPGPTASLRVIAAPGPWTAGRAESVRVQSIDAFGNRTPGDTAAVTMRPSGALSWSPSSGPLVLGEFVTLARDTVTEVVTLAADRAGGGSGGAGGIEVRAADPAGPIPIAAGRDTLTADGRSSTAVTLGPVRDAYGNVVATGSLVAVSAGASGLVATDASPLPGLDLATGSNGTASLLLIAAPFAGTDTLRAASRAGSGAGSRIFTFVPPPALLYEAGTLEPAAVAPGGTPAFGLAVRNVGTASVQIGAGTTLSFGSGAGAYAASLAAPIALAADAVDTLRFSAAALPPSLAPGSYAPALRLRGLDGTGEPFDFYLGFAGNQIHVAGVGVAGLGATPSTVPLGHPDLALQFRVTNPTSLPAVLDDAGLAFSTGAFVLTSGPTPSLPATLPAGGGLDVRFTVRVPDSGITPGTSVGTALTASATFDGVAVFGTSAPLAFTVVSGAQLLATPGSAQPARLLRGRTHAPRIRLRNTGAAALTLARGATRLSLTHPGGDRLEFGLAAATAIAGGDSALLQFDSLAVASSIAKGSYGARLLASGTEAGQSFADTISLDPATWPVLDPALLAATGAVTPDTVSAGQRRSLRVNLSNAGDATFDLDPTTTLALGSPLLVDLALAAPATIAPGATIPLDFTAKPIGSPLTAGAALAVLEARGTEEGSPRSETIAAGTLVARAPANLRYVAGSVRPDTVRAGTTVDFVVDVENAGGSPFTLQPSASRLTLSDGVEETVAAGTAGPIVLDPGARAPLSFPAAGIPAAMASQAYPVTLDLVGLEWGAAESMRVQSAAGEVRLLEPAPGIQVRALERAVPTQALPGGAPFELLALELTALIAPGGATLASVESVALTLIGDASASAAALSSFATVTVRGRGGVVLAAAAPPAGNPLALALSPPLALTAETETLTVEVAVAGAASLESIALRIASASDVQIRDPLTGGTLPVLASGGLPFAPITSRTVTIFARAHGYPNPFHAGREPIRLSYRLPDDASVHVSIVTLFGDLVREIAVSAGADGGARGLNELPWDGRNGAGDLVRPGVYVVRIEAAGVSETVKVGVLR